MTEKIHLKQIERNVFRDYFRDGIVDIMSGAWFLLVGLFIGSMAPFIGFIVFLAPLLEGVKKRFTYPRTGYVELREGDPQPLPWFILGSLVLGLVALLATLIATGDIADAARWYRRMPIFLGILMAGIFLGLTLRAGVVRYGIVAGVALVGGLASTLPSLDGKLANIGLFLATLGGLLLVCGVVTCIRFLRRYPLPEEGAGDVTG